MAVDVLETTVIERPVEVVAEFAGDPSRAPEWCRRIASAEWLTEPPMRLGSRVRFHADFLGRNLDTVYEIVELTRDEQVAMRTTEGPFPLRTTYTWRRLSDRACHMAMRNEAEPAGVAMLATPFIRRAMRRSMRQDLADLTRILESS